MTPLLQALEAYKAYHRVQLDPNVGASEVRERWGRYQALCEQLPGHEQYDVLPVLVQRWWLEQQERRARWKKS